MYIGQMYRSFVTWHFYRVTSKLQILQMEIHWGSRRHIYTCNGRSRNKWTKVLSGSERRSIESKFCVSITINILDDTELPGIGSLTTEQAQSYTPLTSDQSWDNSPPIDYPVSISWAARWNDGRDRRTRCSINHMASSKQRTTLKSNNFILFYLLILYT